MRSLSFFTHLCNFRSIKLRLRLAFVILMMLKVLVGSGQP